MRSINHIYNESGEILNIDKLLKFDPITWQPLVSNEFGRLAAGIRDIKGNNAIKFVSKSSILPHEKVTYAQFVCDERPLKAEKHRVCCVVGGDKLSCDIDAGSPATNLMKFKILAI